MEMRDAFFKALYERAAADPSIVLITGDAGAFWLDKFGKDYPAQFVNAGIAEQNMISMAAGLALAGKKPFVHGINNFITLRALEQIAIDVCSMNLPVVLVGIGAGYAYSTDGPTHHGVCDLGASLSVGLKVYNCSDPMTSKWFAWSVNGPAYIRIEKGEMENLYQPKRFLDGIEMVRNGEHLTISSGYMVHEALKRSGGVIDIQRFPVNADVLEEMLHGRKSVSVLEDNNYGPIAQAIAKICMERSIHIHFNSYHPNDFVFEYGSRDFLHRKAGINVEEKNVAAAVAG